MLCVSVYADCVACCLPRLCSMPSINWGRKQRSFAAGMAGHNRLADCVACLLAGEHAVLGPGRTRCLS